MFGVCKKIGVTTGVTTNLTLSDAVDDASGNRVAEPSSACRLFVGTI